MSGGLLDDETRNLLTRHVYERLNRYEKYRGEEKRLSEIIDLQISELASAIVSGTTYRPYMAKMVEYEGEKNLLSLCIRYFVGKKT